MAITLPVLVFDGDCGFCTSVAHRIEERWPAKSSATTIASHDLDDRALDHLGLSRSQVEEAAWWVDTEGARGGEQAVAAALLEAGGWLAVLARLLRLPGIAQLAPAGYRFVARHRHLLPGATAACKIS